MTWTFGDLSDDELRGFYRRDCECLTAARSGTRGGYRCPAHRAQDELDRRHANGTSVAARQARTAAGHRGGHEE